MLHAERRARIKGELYEKGALIEELKQQVAALEAKQGEEFPRPGAFLADDDWQGLVNIEEARAAVEKGNDPRLLGNPAFSG